MVPSRTSIYSHSCLLFTVDVTEASGSSHCNINVPVAMNYNLEL